MERRLFSRWSGSRVNFVEFVRRDNEDRERGGREKAGNEKEGGREGTACETFNRSAPLFPSAIKS